MNWQGIPPTGLEKSGVFFSILYPPAGMFLTAGENFTMDMEGIGLV